MALAGFASTGTDTLKRPLSWASQGPRPWFYSCWLMGTTYAGSTGAFQVTSNAAIGANTAPRVGLRNTGGFSSWLFTDQADDFSNGQVGFTYASTSGTWFHHAANMTASNSRQAFINATSVGSAATNITTQTLQALQVGYGIGGAMPTGNAVAEIVIGTGTLTSGQLASLAAGANPLAVLDPAQIVCYYPLRSDVIDLAATSPTNLSSGGTRSAAAIAPGSASWVAHPTIDAAPTGGGGGSGGGSPALRTLVSIIT